MIDLVIAPERCRVYWPDAISENGKQSTRSGKFSSKIQASCRFYRCFPARLVTVSLAVVQANRCSIPFFVFWTIPSTGSSLPDRVDHPGIDVRDCASLQPVKT